MIKTLFLSIQRKAPHVAIAAALGFFLISSAYAACGGGCAGGCGCAGGGAGCGGGCGESCGGAGSQAKQAKFAVDNQTLAAAKPVNNTVCPTCDDAIDPESRYQAYYKGKLVNLCCEGCLKEFEKDPDKYLAKAAAPVQNQGKQ